MMKNNRKAKEFGRFLKEAIPTVDFYIPGEHDEFVLHAYKNKYLTEEQILDIDCQILQKCNFMVRYAPNYCWSNGMCVERKFAWKSHIPVITESKETLSVVTVQKIHAFLESLLR